ncbi:tetratricopeptide repeat protein [Terriglobus sp.]|uniref:tetratricopeptide repeat protein n=1 Tax=Terriglobus sp. TaxID=1889013 RepID=UPI003B006FA1
MLPDEWERAQCALEQLFTLHRDARQVALDALHAEDPALAETVANLLRADGETSVLDASLTSLAEAALHHDFVGALVETQIGPYRLLSVLGEGGMGVVYRAERLHLGGQVAIKLLRDAWMSPMRRDRFRLEQRTLARLNHPNIAQIHDAGSLHGDTPWFVMEYVDGLPLTAWAREHHANLPQILALIRQVTGAVACAHRHALVHRDLKPSNILVTPAGEVKLLDFGIVKDLAETAFDGRTVDGLIPLTPGYAAPEQRTAAPIGLFTDIYSLGVLLYELLTGELPRLNAEGFADRPSRVARLASSNRLQFTRAQWSDLDAICDHALQPEPARRYSSADAFLRDIEAFESGRTLAARPPGVFYAMGKFVRRNHLPLSVAAVATILLAITVVVAAVRVTRSRDLALRQLSRMARLQRFTLDLFDGGTPDQGPSAEVTTAMLLQRGELAADGMHDDAELQAAMFATLGRTWQHLGNLNRADTLLRRALAERSPNVQNHADADSHTLYIESLVDLGLLRLDQRRMIEAEALLRNAVALTADRKTITPEAARALGALGDALAIQGNYRESRAVLERAIAAEHHSGLAGTQQFADNLSLLADTQFYMAEFTKAIELDQQALAIYHRTVGENHPSVAHVNNTLGNIAKDQGHFADAEVELSRSLAIDQRWYGPDNPRAAEDYVGLSQVFALTNREGDAKIALEHALAIQEHTYGHRHAAVALILNQLGILADNHDHEDEAEADFQEALAIWRTVYGDNHQFVGMSYSNLAGVYLFRKDYSRAESMARRALTVYQRTLPPEHPNLAAVHVRLGRILLREGRFAEAEPETRQGYDFFRSHDSADSTYLKGARKDLDLIMSSQRDAARANKAAVHSSVGPQFMMK